MNITKVREVTVKNLVIDLQDGSSISARFLTRGQFSKVYQDGDAIYVRTGCRMKEGIALFGQGKDHGSHIPKIRRIWCNLEENESIYKMPLYSKIKKDEHPVAFAQRAKLMTLFNRAISKLALNQEPYKDVMYQKLDLHCQDFRRAFMTELQATDLPDQLKEDFEDLNMIADNYECITLDCGKPSNYMADKDGNLILLDLFFTHNEYKG